MSSKAMSFKAKINNNTLMDSYYTVYICSKSHDHAMTRFVS